MFVWKEKLTAREEIEKVTAFESTARGSNRRAVGLVPFPLSELERDVSIAEKVRYKQLLISIEGKQSTCCLKVVSPKKKSRAALLCYRGRALGCIYGQKDLDSQLLGQEAFERFLDDISIPDSIVDTYILPENLALSATSLFHGEVFHQPLGKGAPETLHFVFQNLLRTRMPGCIVLKRFATDEVLAFIYMFDGEIVGVFTFANGWLEPTLQQALELVETNVAMMVSASKLNACNVDEVLKLSFSLTGMDRPTAYVPRLRPMDLY